MNTIAPLQRLRELTQTGLSGEFICVAQSTEIHVYLQAGRLAWATDSNCPFAFAKHLQSIASIDEETFREVVEHCRRDKLPLGETLVAWGLVPWEAVQQALQHQIAQAVAVLTSLRSAQTLFLERSYSQYAPQLTFGLGDVLDAEAPADTPRHSFLNLDLRGPGLAGQLRQAVDGLSWVQVLQDENVVDSDPVLEGEEARASQDLLRVTLVDGADFAALRSAEGSLVGLRLPQADQSLWCWLAAGATFGSAVSAVGSLVDREPVSPPRSRAHGDEPPWCIGTQDGPLCSELRRFLQRAQEVLGLLVLRPGLDEPLAGIGRASLERDECVDIARRRARCFTTARTHDADAPRSGRLDSMGFYLRSVVTAESTLWCFGTEIDANIGMSTWLFLDRQDSQGLGWAYLSALHRVLDRMSTGGAA